MNGCGDDHLLVFFFCFYIKGSAEEQIKQDLQAVAEGVAASVLHSATSSNPDIHDINESAFEAIQDGDIQNISVDMQHKAKVEVVYLLISFLSSPRVVLGHFGVGGGCLIAHLFAYFFFSLVYFRTRTNFQIRQTLVFQY